MGSIIMAWDVILRKFTSWLKCFHRYRFVTPVIILPVKECREAGT